MSAFGFGKQVDSSFDVAVDAVTAALADRPDVKPLAANVKASLERVVARL